MRSVSVLKMRLVSVLSLLAASLAPLLAGSQRATCEMVNASDLPEEQCHIKMTSIPTKHTREGYTECIRVSVWMKTRDFLPNRSRRIEVGLRSKYEMIFRPTWRGHSNQPQIYNAEKVKCNGPSKQPYARVDYDCFKAEARNNFSVSYNTNCTKLYKVADPRPEFSLSVDRWSKTVSVSVDADEEVNVRICYEQNPALCQGSHPLSVFKSAVLNISHMLPCTCIEVYYTYRDATRHKKCPFKDEPVFDAGDVLNTSEVKLHTSHMTWSYRCPSSGLNVSASLCWEQHEHLCIPLLNSTLEKKDGNALDFNTLNVDRHPKMCVQFSIQGTSRISCLFQNEVTCWEASVEAGRRSIRVLLTSSVPAEFSAQLCVLTEGGCTPAGAVHSLTVTETAADKRINVPVGGVTEKLCVQVWQSDPALNGRRIMCLDYTHNRWGLYAAAVVLICAVLAALLGLFLHRTTKSGTGGLLMIQRPVLLVCSSDQSIHISAVCALASILQGELGATVHTAMWQQNSQRQAGTGASVADLGPIPWLYGQWDAVCKAQGKVLIFWSPEAKRSYERWKMKRGSMDKNEANLNHERIRDAAQENLKLKGKWRKEKSSGRKCCVTLFEDKDWSSQEPSTVMEPVFMAALASLEGALQEGKGKDVAIVYFQGLCHSRDIPKAFRGVPRYCLPQDFSGLLQELAEVRGMENSEFRRSCGHRLLSKVMSMWLARQLARRLRTVLPQTREHEAKSGPSSTEMT